MILLTWKNKKFKTLSTIAKMAVNVRITNRTLQHLTQGTSLMNLSLKREYSSLGHTPYFLNPNFYIF